MEEILSKYWKFSRADGQGEMVAPALRFWPSGMVGGYIHESERFWEWDNGMFRLKNIAGETTTLFDEYTRDEDGLRSMRGRSSLNPDVVHVLERTDMPSLREYGYDGSSDVPVLNVSDTMRKTKRRNLVILRAGEKSLHKTWPTDIGDQDRNWDFCISWYGKDLPSEDLGAHEYFTHQPNDWKYSSIYKLFKIGSPLWEYENVFIPDDDLMTSWKDINKLFNIFRIQKLDLAQPALTKESYISHAITLQNPDFFLRYTSFVEVMCPIFSRDCLQVCLPSFDAAYTGWGLDHIWPLMLGRVPGRLAIIDDIAVTHTRPLQNSYSLTEGTREDLITCAMYKTGRPQTTFGGILGSHRL